MLLAKDHMFGCKLAACRLKGSSSSTRASIAAFNFSCLDTAHAASESSKLRARTPETAHGAL
eukprot:3086074-Prorocentrum_lima.AAC.1